MQFLISIFELKIFINCLFPCLLRNANENPMSFVTYISFIFSHLLTCCCCRAVGFVTQTPYEGDGTQAATKIITTNVAQPPRRRTPPLFNRPHLVASYSMSLLLRVRPKYVARGRLRNDVEVSAPRIKDATSSLLRAYPGPLQGRNLHKDKIISFCKEQIRLGPARACTVLYATQKKPLGNVDKYRASHALMWHLLILLLRQNGVSSAQD